MEFVKRCNILLPPEERRAGSGANLALKPKCCVARFVLCVHLRNDLALFLSRATEFVFLMTGGEDVENSVAQK